MKLSDIFDAMIMVGSAGSLIYFFSEIVAFFLGEGVFQKKSIDSQKDKTLFFPLFSQSFSFWKKNFKNLFLYPLTFAGLSSILFFGYLLEKTPLSVVISILIILGSVFYFSSFCHRIMTLLQKDESIKKTIRSKLNVFLVVTFYLVRVLLAFLYFIFLPIYASNNSDNPPVILILVPLGIFLVPALTMRMLLGYFTLPFMLLEGQPLVSSWKLSPKHTEIIRKQVNLFFTCLILPGFALCAVGYYVYFHLRISSLILYCPFWVLFFSLFSLYLSYFFTSAFFLYHKLIDEYFVPNDANLRPDLKEPLSTLQVQTSIKRDFRRKSTE